MFRPLEGSPTTLAAARLQRLEVQSERMLQDSIKAQGLLTKLQTKVQVSRQDTRIPLRRVRSLRKLMQVCNLQDEVRDCCDILLAWPAYRGKGSLWLHQETAEQNVHAGLLASPACWAQAGLGISHAVC